MIRIRTTLTALRQEQSGATIAEFALILPVFAMMLMGTFDLGYQVYLRSLVNGVLQKASRQATVGTMTSTQVDTYINNQLKAILPASQRSSTTAVTITKKSYTDFSNVGNPESITSDTAPLGSYNSTDCYEDANNNGVWDSAGGATGLGTSDDIVYYEVTVSFPRVFPLYRLTGGSATQSTTAKTMLRNQPFGTQTVGTTRCS